MEVEGQTVRVNPAHRVAFEIVMQTPSKWEADVHPKTRTYLVEQKWIAVTNGRPSFTNFGPASGREGRLFLHPSQGGIITAKKMQHSEFVIGETFWCGDQQWRCTDVGRRTIVAIKADAVGWDNGPPYALAETVFDEYDMTSCSVGEVL